jgi:hypothetical protein
MIGALETIDEIRTAIRDLESALLRFTAEAAPSTDAQVFMRTPEGTFRQYTLVSGGGCTITVDDAAQTISISVP